MVSSVLGPCADMVHRTRTQPGSQLAIRVGHFGTNGEFINGYQYEHMTLVSKLRACLKKTCAERSNWACEPDILLMRSDYTDQVRSTTTVSQNTLIVTKKTRLQHLGVSTNREYDLLVSLTHETVITPDQNSELFRVMNRREPKSVRFIQKALYQEVVTHDDLIVTLKYEILKISPKGVTKIASTGQPCSYECSVTFVSVRGCDGRDGDGLRWRCG